LGSEATLRQKQHDDPAFQVYNDLPGSSAISLSVMPERTKLRESTLALTPRRKWSQAADGRLTFEKVEIERKSASWDLSSRDAASADLYSSPAQPRAGGIELKSPRVEAPTQVPKNLQDRAGKTQPKRTRMRQ